MFPWIKLSVVKINWYWRWCYCICFHCYCPEYCFVVSPSWIIEFKCCDFLNLPKDKIKGYVIYCDIPYKGTTKYKTELFPYEEFYIWANEMAKYNTVLVSEYNMPSNFKCIWEKDIKVNIDKNGNTTDENRKRTEKLFLCSIKND